MSGSSDHAYEPLDASGCRDLADTLGDTSHTIIATQLLRRGLCKAYVVGDPAQFDGAIVQARDFPDEPAGYGSDPAVIWDLLQSVDGWFCILVSTECAPVLGEMMQTEMGVSVRYLDDVCCEMRGPAPEAWDEDVRLLTLEDLNLLESAPPELRASCYADTRDLLTDGIVACAIVDGEIVATALAAARSERYAEVGIYTCPEYRRRGYATSAAALVCKRAQESGQTPVLSVGSHNAASLRVAEKLGFVEVSRSRYVIIKEREPTAGG